MKRPNRSLNHIRAPNPNRLRRHRFLNDLYTPNRRSIHRPSLARLYRTRALQRQLLAYFTDNMDLCRLTILRAPFLKHRKRLRLPMKKRRNPRPAFRHDQYHSQLLLEKCDDMKRSRPHHLNLLAHNTCKSIWLGMTMHGSKNHRHTVALDIRHRRHIRLLGIVCTISTK